MFNIYFETQNSEISIKEYGLKKKNMLDNDLLNSTIDIVLARTTCLKAS